ncbi:MAG: hypothetical protein AAF211_24845, partial [Myxococcota bacterium]
MAVWKLSGFALVIHGCVTTSQLESEPPPEVVDPVETEIGEIRRCSTPTPRPDEIQRDQVRMTIRSTTAVSLTPGSVTIPVAFHVVTSAGGAGTLPLSAVQAQMDVLNASYGGLTS